MKKCNKCHNFKAFVEMKGTQCKPCYNSYRRQLRANYKLNNPEYHEQERQKERGRTYSRKYWPTLNYSDALAMYDSMFLKQNGKCKVCEKQLENKYLCVDHCHKTGKVRGLLCNTCNVAIAFLQDSPLLINKLSNYLMEQA